MNSADQNWKDKYFAVCVRPDEPSYEELRAQRDELLAALEVAQKVIRADIYLGAAETVAKAIANARSKS